MILDLIEVGEFFYELISSKKLDVKTLPLVGFEFIQHYFISVNENSSNLLRVAKKEKKKESNNYTNMVYGTWVMKNTELEKPEEDEGPQFKLIINPREMDKLDLIWELVLNSESQEVIPLAVDFLIKIYMSLDEALMEDSAQIQQDLIA